MSKQSKTAVLHWHVLVLSVSQELLKIGRSMTLKFCLFILDHTQCKKDLQRTLIQHRIICEMGDSPQGSQISRISVSLFPLGTDLKKKKDKTHPIFIYLSQELKRRIYFLNKTVPRMYLSCGVLGV